MDCGNIEFVQKNVLLDIEGTTTSISFVKNTLFPYAREHLNEYIENNWSNEELQSVIILLRKQSEEDVVNNVPGFVPIITESENEKKSIIQNVNWQMDVDRKTIALKKLQGLIWRDGYLSGLIKSHLYDDVVPALHLWKQHGRNLHIYSSGSVEAQKLLFGHSIHGSLLELFSNHFDTNIGSKIDTQSYLKIAKTLKCNCDDILFLTDAVKEAEAAAGAGYNVIILERPGNVLLSSEEKRKYSCIQSFSQLFPKY